MSVKDLIIDSNKISLIDILSDTGSKTKASSSSKKSDKKYVPRKYTPEEINDMITDYLVIKKEDWYSIPLESHVRYIKTDNAFVAGGYLKRKWKREDNIYFSIGKSPYSEDKKWVVNLTNVDIIYKRLNEGSRMEVELIKKSLISMDNRIKNIESGRRNSTDSNTGNATGLNIGHIRSELELLRRENTELKQQNERLKGSLKKTNGVVAQIAKYVSKKKK
jgi:3-dehydroquinate synthase class II